MRVAATRQAVSTDCCPLSWGLGEGRADSLGLPSGGPPPKPSPPSPVRAERAAGVGDWLRRRAAADAQRYRPAREGCAARARSRGGGTAGHNWRANGAVGGPPVVRSPGWPPREQGLTGHWRGCGRRQAELPCSSSPSPPPARAHAEANDEGCAHRGYQGQEGRWARGSGARDARGGPTAAPVRSRYEDRCGTGEPNGSTECIQKREPSHARPRKPT